MEKGGVPPLPGLTVFGLWSWGSRPRLFDVSLLRSLAGAGDWGINRSAGQEKPRVSSSSAVRWFSIAAAAGEIRDLVVFDCRGRGGDPRFGPGQVAVRCGSGLVYGNWVCLAYRFGDWRRVRGREIVRLCG